MRKRSDIDSGSGSPLLKVGYIFALVFSILLACSLWASLHGFENKKTLEGFLDFLTTVPSIPMDFLTIPTIDTVNIFLGGLTPFMRLFIPGINGLIEIINGVLYFVKLTTNALTFVIWFFRWFFFL